jgi:hypothetical protein
MMLLGSSAAFILFMVRSDSMPSSFSRYCKRNKKSISNNEVMTYVKH